MCCSWSALVEQLDVLHLFLKLYNVITVEVMVSKFRLVLWQIFQNFCLLYKQFLPDAVCDDISHFWCKSNTELNISYWLE